MKKIKLLLIALIGFIPFSVSANSVHCNAPGSVESGETFGVTFYGSLSGAGGIWLGNIGSEGNAQYQRFHHLNKLNLLINLLDIHQLFYEVLWHSTVKS